MAHYSEQVVLVVNLNNVARKQVSSVVISVWNVVWRKDRTIRFKCSQSTKQPLLVLNGLGWRFIDVVNQPCHLLNGLLLTLVAFYNTSGKYIDQKLSQNFQCRRLETGFQPDLIVLQRKALSFSNFFQELQRAHLWVKTRNKPLNSNHGFEELNFISDFSVCFCLINKHFNRNIINWIKVND